MRRIWYDYGFRACPTDGLFQRKSRDPVYLCDEHGDILAWTDATVIDLTTDVQVYPVSLAGRQVLVSDLGEILIGGDGVALVLN